MNATRIKQGAIGLAVVGMAFLFVGCHSFGPKSLEYTHALYNQAIVTSLNEQFLQNLVRLRYRDTPYFLEIGSVTASLKLETSVGVGSALSTGPGAELFSPNVGIEYSTTPTISYAPLQGEDFLKNVLSPISLDSLFVLTQSGWSAQRVFGLCVERINNLENVPTASGPTPQERPPDFEPFDRLLDLLESIRHQDQVRSTMDPETKQLVVQMKPDPEGQDVVSQIKALLGLDPELPRYIIDSDFVRETPETISIRTRSIMSMLFYLSHNVEIPPDHEKAGFVTITRDANGERFDWKQTPGGSLFRVRFSARRPASAYLSVPYRGYWFYIDNSDLESKSTFMLISQLFSLQAGNVKSTGPALTIPVTR